MVESCKSDTLKVNIGLTFAKTRQIAITKSPVLLHTGLHEEDTAQSIMMESNFQSNRRRKFYELCFDLSANLKHTIIIYET